MENKKQNKVFVYQAAILMITTFLSRIFGLVREVIIAYLLGISGISDAFLASFKITNFLRIFLGEGALGGAFIPVYTETIEKEGREEADKLASNVLNIMCVILVLCTILGIVAAPLIIKITTGGMPVQLQRIAVNLTRIMFSYLIFIGLAGLVMVVLNSLGHFIIPSLNPIMFSISIISCGIFLSKKLGAGKALALGVLIGGILQFLIQLPVLKKYDFKYFFVFNFKEEKFKKIIVLVLPVVLGVVITRINTIVDQRFASSLVVGSIAALTFATRLMDLPLGVFGVAISTVIFPLLSKLAIKEENREEFKLTLKKGSLLVFFITIPAAVGLIVLGKVLISLLFQHGRFTYENTLMAYKALIFYSIGLPFFAAIHTVTRAFYALQDTKTPIKIGAFIVGFNIILNYFLIKTVLNYSGLALATSVCAIINFFTLTYFLKRKINILWSQTFFSIAKMFLSAILMGALTYLLLNNVLTFKAPYDFNNFVTILKGFFKIILNILLSVCFYFICSYFICPEGISITKEIISKRKINN